MFNKIVFVLAIFFFESSVMAVAANEAEYRSIEALKAQGVNRCAGAMSTITKFLYEVDNFAYLNQWNKGKPDQHSSQSLISKKYSDTVSISSITSSPTTDNSCDTNFTQVLVSSDSCAKLRDTLFKDWKYYHDLEGTAIYEDPTTESVSLTLTAIENSCLIVKTGLLFYPMDK